LQSSKLSGASNNQTHCFRDGAEVPQTTLHHLSLRHIVMTPVVKAVEGLASVCAGVVSFTVVVSLAMVTSVVVVAVVTVAVTDIMAVVSLTISPAVDVLVTSVSPFTPVPFLPPVTVTTTLHATGEEGFLVEDALIVFNQVVQLVGQLEGQGL